METTGCAEELEYLKGFQKMIEFVKMFVLPLLEISVCKLLFKYEMNEFSLVERTTSKSKLSMEPNIIYSYENNESFLCLI